VHRQNTADRLKKLSQMVKSFSLETRTAFFSQMAVRYGFSVQGNKAYLCVSG